MFLLRGNIVIGRQCCVLYCAAVSQIVVQVLSHSQLPRLIIIIPAIFRSIGSPCMGMRLLVCSHTPAFAYLDTPFTRGYSEK